jgi:anthranilate phosphoribosyltransferase
LLELVLAGGALTREESRDLAGSLFDGREPPARIAALLGVWCSRLPSFEEFSGVLDALLQRAVPIDLGDEPCIDLCGTGGDGKDTFNISTTTSFIVAGCGVRVAKHGNYGASSRVGSSNVLEALGIPLVREPSLLKRCLDYAGISFIHAPYFHPTLGALAPIRRELGVRTIFNLLGPLANPARPAMQYVGVSDRRVMRLFARVLAERGAAFCIVHADDGYDEITLTGSATVVTNRGWFSVRPEQEGDERVDPAVLRGTGNVDEHAAVVEAILLGEDRSPRLTVVVANAARALSLARPGASAEACRHEVTRSIESGKAHRVLLRVREFAQQVT